MAWAAIAWPKEMAFTTVDSADPAVSMADPAVSKIGPIIVTVMVAKWQSTIPPNSVSR